jgi:putative colanic acid biosynthesis acetyltransferase WcaF
MVVGFRSRTGLRCEILNNSRPGIIQLDILANRKARKYSRSDFARRSCWTLGKWLVRSTPRPCFAWRSFLLRVFGATVGAHVRIDPSVRILFPWNLAIGDWCALGQDVRIYNPGLIVLGQKVTISHGAHLCAGTHDYTRADLPLRKVPIWIGDEAWVCADAFIGPGSVVGRGAVVGARAVVSGPVADWTVVAGNPAKEIGPRELQAARTEREPPITAV